MELFPQASESEADMLRPSPRLGFETASTSCWHENVSVPDVAPRQSQKSEEFHKLARDKGLRRMRRSCDVGRGEAEDDTLNPTHVLGRRSIRTDAGAAVTSGNKVCSR